MRTDLAANRRHLSFSAHAMVSAGSVDVLMNGRRIWSTKVPVPARNGRITLRWPRALTPYLSGTGTVEVRDSASGAALASAEVRFGRSNSPVSIRDAQGRWLTVSKWMHMSPSIESDVAVRAQLIADAARLTKDLQTLGWEVYITGGTLLGAVRSGDILPHDDDIDLAVLFPHDHPADLSLASFRMEDQLNQGGYNLIRHSAAHVQVEFSDETGELSHHVDIFTAFFQNGTYSQPFHVRTPMDRAAIIPTKNMTLAGSTLPAPAVPSDWLVSCYGANWETPDPSFRFETPVSTRRRFENWFGSLNASRDYWEHLYGAAETPDPVDKDSKYVTELSLHVPNTAPVVVLGCGTGAESAAIARHGHKVIGIDFSERALDIARRQSPVPVEWRMLNLSDRRRMLEFGLELVRSGAPWHFTLNNVLEGLTAEGRETVFLFLRLVLTDGAFAFVTIDTNLVRRHFDPGNPQTWHLPLSALRKEAGRHEMKTVTVATGWRSTPFGRRRTATVKLFRGGPASDSQNARQENSAAGGLLRFILTGLAPQRAAKRAEFHRTEENGGLVALVRSVEAEVRELRANVDEMRKDNLRIAELYDLVFRRLNQN